MGQAHSGGAVFCCWMKRWTRGWERDTCSSECSTAMIMGRKAQALRPPISAPVTFKSFGQNEFARHFALLRLQQGHIHATGQRTSVKSHFVLSTLMEAVHIRSLQGDGATHLLLEGDGGQRVDGVENRRVQVEGGCSVGGVHGPISLRATGRCSLHPPLAQAALACAPSTGCCTGFVSKRVRAMPWREAQASRRAALATASPMKALKSGSTSTS